MSSEQDLRQEIIGIVDELYANQMITPTGGNVSVRVTDEEDAYLITPSMLYKGSLKPEHIVKVNCKGKACERRQRPSVETPVHLSVYAALPDVEAVIHCHAKRCIALGLVNGSIPPISVDAVPFTDTQVIPYNLPGTPELCADVVKALQRSPAVLLQGHGLVTVGWTLRQAANRALAIEEVVEILLACKQFGKEPVALPPETVEMMKAAGVV
jgi:L-ribulose-5-phosphate 4-epimerase